MRAGRVAGVLVAGALAFLPASAHAGARADYKQMFTTPVPGASTGSDTEILYKHPDDPQAKPIPVREEVFTFPKGTTWDTTVVPDCTVTDVELMLLGRDACPPETWIGEGKGDTSMSGFPGAGETKLIVNGFDRDAGVRVAGGAEPFGPYFVAQLVRKGRVVTVQVPRTPGGPPDGESALRYVHNVFPPRSLGGRAYTRTPPVCPSSGVWRFEARFTFADGVVEHDVYDMPCSR
jgi:hypothetical protein